MPTWSFERRREVLYYEMLSSTAQAIAEFIRQNGDSYEEPQYEPFRAALAQATGYHWPPDDDPAYCNVFRNYLRVLKPFSVATVEEGRLQLLWVGQWLAEKNPSKEEFYRVLVETFRYPNDGFATRNEWVDSGRELHPFRAIVETFRFLNQYGAEPYMTPLEIFICLYNAHDNLPPEVLGDAVIRYRSAVPAPAELPRMADPTAEDADYRQVREIVWFLVEGGVLHNGETIRGASRLTLDEAYLPSSLTVTPPPAEQTHSMVEGAVHQETITLRRRNPNLRPSAIEHYGHICAVCHEEFGLRSNVEFYVLEVHHLIPVADAEGPRAVTVDDVRVVCANCHRMLHSQAPPLSLSALRTLLHL